MVSLPVSLSVGQPANLTVIGTFCQPANWSEPHMLDVLTPGGTYNADYWDWQYDQPDLYSFVHKILGAGRATFAYDRIGTGKSSHPLSAQVTVQAEAYVLHQIVQWAHQHTGQVNAYGHSFGSMITDEEAGTYHDVDRIIITGMLHLPNVGPNLPGAVGSLYPAALDSQFVNKGLDLGYLTTRPARRGQLFYNLATADPSVITHDEAHKDIVSVGGIASLPTTYGVPAPLNASNRITAPVLLVVGQQDGAFCLLPSALYCTNKTALRAFEAPYYTAAQSLDAAVIPNTGHDLTLHPSANTSFQVIDQWVETH
jgi:pimeloyl-ACP methyl ester carboxylesterase